jgi:hypothetical protein
MFKFKNIFKKKQPNPALAFPVLVERLDNILKLENVAEKTEQLLSFRELLEEKRKETLTKSLLKSIGSLALMGGIYLAVSIFAPVAATMVFWGLCVVQAAVNIFHRDDYDRAKTMRYKVNKEISALIDSNPQEVKNSPKFQQSVKNATTASTKNLKRSFFYAADTNAEFADLTEHVAKKKAAAQKLTQ